MKIYRFITTSGCFFLVLIFCLSSCNNNSKISERVEELVGKEIILPEEDLIRNFKSNEIQNPLNKRIKIFTVINAGCGICIEDLENWKEFMLEIDLSKIGIVYLCFSEDHLNNFERINEENLNLNYPYFEDVGKRIFSKNNFGNEKLYQTFLLDESNKVILVGDPNQHKSIKKLYLEEIKKMTSTD